MICEHIGTGGLVCSAAATVLVGPNVAIRGMALDRALCDEHSSEKYVHIENRGVVRDQGQPR